MFMDNKFRKPRIWSNKVLQEMAHLFEGNVGNISGWKDDDKQGKKYRSYFKKASSYFISNYKAEARGLQGNLENEFFLDLEKDLDTSLINNFDVVLNHTVLEHVFEVQNAFKNLCLLSKDIVIVIVPFLQEQHGDYGDFWRFTPLALKKLFQKNNKEMIYVNYNDSKGESIYVFAVGSSDSSKWSKIVSLKSNKIDLHKDIGTKHIRNTFFNKVLYKLKILK